MFLLIAYATTDGQTRKIARFAADRLAGTLATPSSF
jgi:menaquinone-dependent protoporphyrinogen oxidase